MRRYILIIMIIVLMMIFTSCGYLTGRTEEMINDYNERLEQTVLTYEDLKQKAEENKEELYSYILGEKPTYHGKEYINDLNKVIINDSHFVIRDDYFTAMDAIALREVLVLTGDSLIYVEVIWGADGVISITRRAV